MTIQQLEDLHASEANEHAEYPGLQLRYRRRLYQSTCISDLHQVPGFLRQSADDQNMMLMLNLADDCFKARKKAASLEAKAEMMEKEIYNLKHELITNQLRNENK